MRRRPATGDKIGHTLGTAYFHEQWGYAHQGLGQHEQAITRLENASELFASQDALSACAVCRLRLDSYRALQRHQDACEQLEWCVAAFAELGRTTTNTKPAPR